MPLNAPAVKPRSSLQRLKAKVGLNKKLPPTPETAAVARSAAPAEVERSRDGQRDVVASTSASARDGAKATKQDAEPSNSIGSSDLTHAQEAIGAHPIADAKLEEFGSPLPRKTTMSRKSSNPLFRFSTRFRSNSSPDEPRPTSTTPIPPLPKGLKHQKTVIQHASATSQARREAALRATGLMPAEPVKTLSQREAEENARVGIAKLPGQESGSASEAAELVKMWRTKSATSSLSKGADPSSRPHTPLVASSPAPQSRSSPISPASPRSRRSLDIAHTHTSTDSTEKVQQWLKQSPQSSPRPDRLSKDSERERFVSYTMPRSPVAAAIPHVVSPRAGQGLELAEASDSEDYFSLPNSPQPVLSNAASPTSRTFSDDLDHASTSTHPAMPMLVPSSSVGSDTSCSAGPPTPSLPLTPTFSQPRGFSAHRGAPSGIAPIIVETSEDGVLVGDCEVVVSSRPKVPSAELSSSAPASVREFGDLLAPAPPPAKTERRTSGLFFAKRTSTLPTHRAEAHAPAGLHRGATIATPNGRPSKLGRRPTKLPSPPVQSAPALRPTIHSIASIEQSMRAIEDDETRRLSEVAYF